MLTLHLCVSSLYDDDVPMAVTISLSEAHFSMCHGQYAGYSFVKLFGATISIKYVMV